MRVGQVAEVKRVFRQEDFNRFAALSGDDNPIHVDPAFSARTKFGRTVAHGMLLYSTVSAALGTRLPGPGTLQLEQELMFPNPTYTDQEITIQLEVTQVQSDEGLADLKTVIARPDGALSLRGRTLVRLPNAPPSTKPTSQQTNQQTNQPTIQPTNHPPIHPPIHPPFKGLEIGQRAETRRTFTTEDLIEYADLTGDSNPIFTDADYARQLGFETSIIPGGLLGGLFSFLLGTRLPGRGTNYLKQWLAFPAPAYPGQELRASVEIVRLRPEKQLVNLSTLCYNPGNEVVCQGEALVLVSDVDKT